jgi:hypothetical protein
MATIYRVDGTIEELEGTGPNRTVTLEQCQEAVGGCIDRVPVLGTRDRELVVNDEGLLEGLPLNRTAARLAGQPIVGDVLLVRFDDAGEWY